MGWQILAPHPLLLLCAAVLDAVLGDPQYAWHPIRLMGNSLAAYERLLRRIGWDGYIGGCWLLVLLALTWVVLPPLALAWLYRFSNTAGFVLHVLLAYTLLALRDLVDHVRAVQRAANRNDAVTAREAISHLVGRDTSKMDVAACRRAAIESLAENFVDGYLSALFWYGLLGLPGLLLFKVASTMDSMVGYKTPQYLRFGWCGARLDDMMNYLPARLAWLLLGLAAVPFPGLSAREGWRIGWQQHAIVPGPNPGWSEATIAGILQRRLIGPMWKAGTLVTTVWLGDPGDPEGGAAGDVQRALWVTITAATLAVAAVVTLLAIR